MSDGGKKAMRDDVVRMTKADLSSRARTAWSWGFPSEVVAQAAREWSDGILGERHNGHATHTVRSARGKK